MMVSLRNLVILTALAVLIFSPAQSDDKNVALANEALRSLGHLLFFDKSLSADGSVACANCHQPELRFSDGRRVSIGIAGRSGVRNAPSLQGVADRRSLFWDGRRATLEEMAIDPLVNPVEHGLADEAAVSAALSRIKAFEEFFRTTESSRTTRDGAVTRLQLYRMAMANFLRSLPRAPSRLERFQRGDSKALSEEEIRGMTVFQGAGKCSSCHTLDNSSSTLTDDRFHSVGVGMDSGAKLGKAAEEAVRQKSAGEAASKLAAMPEFTQLGRFLVTENPRDIGKFKTPSLKGVAYTAPYMHDGSVNTLEEALSQEIYYRSLSEGQIVLSPRERAALLAFLRAL